MAHYDLQELRLYADFNGLFGDILCLAHGDTCRTLGGDEVELREGMIVTAHDKDGSDVGDDLIATGVVERSPDSLSCNGSVWCLRIDENGVRSESEIHKSEEARTRRATATATSRTVVNISRIMNPNSRLNERPR